MIRRPPTPVDPETPVRQCPKRGAGLNWPGPVHEHLDRLCEDAIRDGEVDTLSRSEVASALIWLASSEGLVEKLREYRHARVGDRLPKDGNVVNLNAHRPG